MIPDFAMEGAEVVCYVPNDSRTLLCGQGAKEETDHVRGLITTLRGLDVFTG
jgi:hypothetical protein